MKTKFWLIPAAVAGALLSGAAQAATCTSAQYGSFVIGAVTFYNDVWGSGAGPQTICANSATSFYITSNQPNTGGIKAYGNANYNINKPLSSINTLKSTLSQTTPSGGAWDAAYDVWDTSHSNEIMIWTNYTGTATGGGNVKPISSQYDASGNAKPAYTNVSIGGATYNVFVGSAGQKVMSFLRTSKTNNATTDIRAILNWAKSVALIGNITVGQVQYGVEVTSSPGTAMWVMNNYTVTSN